MIPVGFEGCFGWYHPAGGSRGVVLCSPHGYEALCVHRLWRHFADRLAAAGLPTLRFDYHGTGDSVGTDEEPGRVRAWLDSIHAAVAELRRLSGVEEVALVGLRLGALLAAQAAAELKTVRRLAMMAPVTQGRAYARELKVLGMMAAPPGSEPEPPASDDVEAAGFVLTRATATELGRFDLGRLTERPAEEILVLNRPDAPTDPRLVPHLIELGVTVEEATFEDYASLVQDARLAQPADRAFDAVTQWLTRDQGPSISATPDRSPEPAALILPEGREEAVLFGPDQRLVGILTVPDRPRPGQPVLLFINTGSNHRIGAGRFAVTAARRLAGAGFASFRFDLAGIGDSRPPDGVPENRLYAIESCADVQAALDWLQARGYGSAVAVGLCSGAYLALQTALLDPRIVRLELINLQRFVFNEGDSTDVIARKTYRSTRFYLETARRRETWERVLKGEVDVTGIAMTLAERGYKRALAKVEAVRGRWLDGETEPDPIVRSFFRMLDRGVDTLFVYSAEDGGLDELEARFGSNGKKLAGRAHVRLEIIERADHILSTRAARDWTIELIRSHLDDAGAGGDGGVEPGADRATI